MAFFVADCRAKSEVWKLVELLTQIRIRNAADQAIGHINRLSHLDANVAQVGHGRA